MARVWVNRWRYTSELIADYQVCGNKSAESRVNDIIAYRVRIDTLTSLVDRALLVDAAFARRPGPWMLG